MKFRIFVTTFIALCALGSGTKVLAAGCCHQAGACWDISPGWCVGTYYNNCCDVSDQASSCNDRCDSYAPPDFESDGEIKVAQQLHKSYDRVANERAVLEVGQETYLPTDVK